MFDKKQKSCVEPTHMVPDDCTNEKLFIKSRTVYSSSMNDGKFINY